MVSSLISLVTTVSKRILADRLVVAAALLTILTATVLLTSGPIYADALTVSALQQRLDEAPPGEANLAIETNVFPTHLATVDAVVTEGVREALAAVGADVLSHMEADSHQIGEEIEGGPIDLASIQYHEGIEAKATLIDGRWPEDAGPPHETAISDTTAHILDLAVGDVVILTNRRETSVSVPVIIVGVFEVDDVLDAFWFDDPLVTSGSAESAGFRTLGPFVVSRETMLETFTPGRTAISWRVFPRFENLSAGEISDLREAVIGLPGDLNRKFLRAMDGDLAGSSEITIETSLERLLAGVDRSITVTRASVLAVLVQLAVLAGYALALTAGLIANTRQQETHLTRSRGAGPSHLLAAALGEALLLTLPAVAIGPYLASTLLRLLNHFGPLASVGLAISPEPNREAFVVAGLAALLAVVILATPAFLSARRSHSSATRRSRQLSLRPTQRVGVDLALVTLAGFVFWQLRVLGPEVAANIRGRLGVDPILIVAPSLGLLAGAVLSLRVIPLLARAAERIAAGGRRAIAALASWQVARRPVGYARSALLLIMAVGIGFFAATYSTTWSASQRDQAAHQVGSDITLAPDISVSGSMDDLFLTTSHESITGVDASMPVRRLTGSLASGDEIVRFLLIDTAKAAEVVRIRPDQAPGFAEMMETLAEQRPTLASVPLPGEPEAMALEFDAMEVVDEEDQEDPDDQETRPVSANVSVILQDGDGLLHRLPVGPLVIDGGKRSMVLDLSVPLPNGRTGTPTHPVSLAAIEIESLITEENHTIDLSLLGLEVRSEGTWSQVPISSAWEDWSQTQSAVVGANTRPSISAGQPLDQGLAMVIETGAASPPNRVFFALRPAGSTLPDTFPIVVSESFTEARSETIGDSVFLRPLPGVNSRAVVSATVASFPTVDDPSIQAVVADLPTVQMISYEPGLGLPRVDEYWLSTRGGHEQVVGALQAAPFRSREVTSSEQLSESLLADPIALGTVGALTVGFVAAAILAAVGFAVSATVSARERLVEFSLMRAVGLSTRQLAGWLLLEQGVLIGVGLVMGTLTGALLTTAVLPHISLTQDGSPVVPGAIIEYPWTTIATLEAAILGLLFVIVTIMTVSLRRAGLGSHLKLGEDR